MSKIESHRDLIVWQKAMDLTVDVYSLSKLFPREETSDRANHSFGRFSSGEYRRGSLAFNEKRLCEFPGNR
jgi:hypothetical protein